MNDSDPIVIGNGAVMLGIPCLAKCAEMARTITREALGRVGAAPSAGIFPARSCECIGPGNIHAPGRHATLCGDPGEQEGYIHDCSNGVQGR